MTLTPTPDQKKAAAAIFSASAEGKKIEWHSDRQGWIPADPFSSTSYFNVLQYPERYRRALWKLPAPPAGRRWHRDDFTEADLPEGWRPLLKEERIEKGDELRCQYSSWRPFNHAIGEITRAGATEFHRTRRPLPTEPKAPTMASWDSPEDVPGPVCWIGEPPITSGEETTGSMVLAIDAEGFNIINSLNELSHYTWADIASQKMVYSTDRKTWKPCTKEVSA